MGSLIHKRLIMYKHGKFRNTTVTKWNTFVLVLLTKHNISRYPQMNLISEKLLVFISGKYRHTARHLYLRWSLKITSMVNGKK